ncbi:MAG: AMP-binding protein [Clostridiales Family XIII bacterium]|jgi:long-chain acyl-CoA synthetase|nr:AMP-binding protein [Clostridiales Family XIII bacterium]
MRETGVEQCSPVYLFGEVPLDLSVEVWAEKIPKKTAIVFHGTEISYGALASYIRRFASYLAGIGVGKHDHVVIFMHNCPQFVIALFAVQRIGAIACPINPLFKKWDLEREVNALDARVIIANTSLYDTIAQVATHTLLTDVILTSMKYFLPKFLVYEFICHDPEPDHCDANVTMMMDAVLKTEDSIVGNEHRDMGDISLILFTSGSTGLPKGAMLTHRNGLYKCAATASFTQRNSDNIWIHTQPMCHIAGLLYANMAFYTGAQIVLTAWFSPKVFCEAVDAYKADSWYGTSLMARCIMDYSKDERYNLSSLQLSVMSSFGIQTTRELADEWTCATCGGLLMEGGFGLTETFTMDTVMPPDGVVFGSNGTKALEEMEIRIVEDGRDMPVGETGEIVLRNKGVFKGYLHNPKETAQILRDGWLYTGDIGRLDENGYLYFLGRRKEMMKVHGFSVFPEEVESYLNRHAAIEESAVVKATLNGKDCTKAFIVLKPEYAGKTTDSEIIFWASEQMAAYKSPKIVKIIERIPMTATGKILRRELEELE